jgi:hypothetical protein
MPALLRLYSDEVRVGCVHLVREKGREVSGISSMVRRRVSSVGRDGKKGRAGVLQTRYIFTPHLVPKGWG